MALAQPQKLYRLIVQLFDPLGWDGISDREGPEYRSVLNHEPERSDIDEVLQETHLRHPGKEDWPATVEVEMFWSQDKETEKLKKRDTPFMDTQIH